LVHLYFGNFTKMMFRSFYEFKCLCVLLYIFGIVLGVDSLKVRID